MKAERIAELHHMAAEGGLPGDGTEVLAECLDEIERLRGWFRWQNVYTLLHPNEHSDLTVERLENAAVSALAGEPVPS